MKPLLRPAVGQRHIWQARLCSSQPCTLGQLLTISGFSFLVWEMGSVPGLCGGSGEVLLVKAHGQSARQAA